MLLNNWHRMVFSLPIKYGTSRYSQSLTTSRTNILSTSNYTYATGAVSLGNERLNGTDGGSENRIFYAFSTDDTPVSPDDCSTDLTKVIPTASLNVQVSGYSIAPEYGLQFLVKNNTSSEITINSLVICPYCKWSNAYQICPLVFREVFEGGFKIPAGQSKTILIVTEL